MGRDDSFDDVPVADVASIDDQLEPRHSWPRRWLAAVLMVISLRTAWFATRLLPRAHPYRAYIEGTSRTHRELARVYGFGRAGRRGRWLIWTVVVLAASAVAFLLLADPLDEVRETVLPG